MKNLIILIILLASVETFASENQYELPQEIQEIAARLCCEKS